jgi:ribonuclease HI
MTTKAWTVNIDGASRGNPGAAAYALVIERPGEPVWEEADCLGRTTNNIAEYTALIRALERCRELGGKRLHIRSDSELLVKQMNGEYKVKNADLKVLYDKGQDLLEHFERVDISHVYREQNKHADALCNAALDSHPVQPSRGSAPTPAATLHERAVACMESAAAAWADGDPAAPSPEAVWDMLWAMVQAAPIAGK